MLPALKDCPKTINSTLESMEESTSTSLSPGDELSPPHLLPKAKNFASSRLEFSGKPILTGKHLSKQRSRRVSEPFYVSLCVVSCRLISRSGFHAIGLSDLTTVILLLLRLSSTDSPEASATPPPPPPPHSLSPGAAALHPDSHTIRLSKTHIEKLTNHTAATGATAAAATATACLLHSLSTPLGVR
ncbi:unnamed protein product [Hydatigera taeniaeformis]|uniref:Uncharacterized protein n=1 Tax=Hydatigena taeniaeformis TaxID=6205 RepID=A0A0R3X4Q6_HYDTA|nr:unnamed protein product [Hydatigera taeniaeformis]